MHQSISWPEVVKEHGPAVWRTVYRLLGNRDDAAECYQEVFLEAVRVSREHDVEKWGALLTTIAARRSVDRLRQNLARRSVQANSNALEAMSPRNRAATESATDAELAQRLRSALSDLSERQAEVFWLNVIEEMSYEEIASRLSLSIDYVGVLLHRARAKLRETLGRELLEERSLP
jgi:RNA polymerase sigma-70 factor (ECF subfamily)